MMYADVDGSDIPVEEMRRRRAVYIKRATDRLADALRQALDEADEYTAALIRQKVAARQLELSAETSESRAARRATELYAVMLHRLALELRTIARVGARAWRPGTDIAGTGLSRRELQVICEVAGFAPADGWVRA